MRETTSPDLFVPVTSTLPQLAIGVDLVEVTRIAATLERFGDRFLNRVFTVPELAIVGRDPLRLAGRFAAKEACAKALGTGIDGLGWRDLECLRDSAGRPTMRLHGPAARLAYAHAWEDVAVSISTTASYAIAMIIATGSANQGQPHDD